MTHSRRDFLRRLGVGGAGLALAPALAGRGLEAAWAPGRRRAAPPSGSPIRLDSNENPNGPSAESLDAIRGSLTEASRYPDQPEDRLREAIAAAHGVAPEWVLLGCGSTEILRVAVMAFGRADRPLVSAAPTFEAPVAIAGTLGVPAIPVPVDRNLRLDLDAMARAGAPHAGLLFVCNPNNPTATVHGAAAIQRFLTAAHTASPGATVLIDEAYHEYVEDASYRTAIPLVKDDPRLVVSRTLSKVHGLAGMRAGYAIARPETIAVMEPWCLPSAVSVAAAAAGVAALAGAGHVASERTRNSETRAFTRRVFEDVGYQVGPSETNFIMVDIRRDAKSFKAACLARGIAVGRQFPPFLNHSRISIGTMDEMQQAARVFRAVLASS